MKNRKHSLSTVALLSLTTVLSVANLNWAGPQKQHQSTCDCQKSQGAFPMDMKAQDNQPGRAYIHGYNVPYTGLALEGYSPVSYFTEGVAQKGSPQFTVDHNNVTYYLTSAKQMQEFTANPDRYLPEYGGWCALGMAISDKLPIDPRLFKIVDGKLYLFLKNPKVDALKIWNDGHEEQFIQKAQAYWKKVSG